MATKAAAMPQLVRKNCRRLRPSRLALASASSLMRASTFFWVALCRGGRYSPLETIWVGIGVAAEAASAPATRRCSRSLSQIPIGFLRLAGQREEPIVARTSGALGRLQRDGLDTRLQRVTDRKARRTRGLQAVDRAAGSLGLPNPDRP